MEIDQHWIFILFFSLIGAGWLSITSKKPKKTFSQSPQVSLVQPSAPSHHITTAICISCVNIFDSVGSTATTVDVNSWKIPHEGLLCLLFCEFHLNSRCLILVHHETAAHSNPTGKHINTKKLKNKQILILTYTSMEWICAHPWICASSVLLGPELHILPDQVRLIRPPVAGGARLAAGFSSS